MKGFVEEFKAFAMKGNIIDLAVAVVIGTAFGKIVSSLVTDIIMPFIGVFLGGISFTDMSYRIGESTVTYGVFLQAVVDFVIVAFVIFLVIKTINKAEGLISDDKEKNHKIETPAKISEEVKLLTEIRDNLINRQ